MKLERVLSADRYLMGIVDQILAPAMLFDHTGMILRCNTAMEHEAGQHKGAPFYSALSPTCHEKAVAFLGLAAVSDTVSGRFLMRTSHKELVVSCLHRSDTSGRVYLGIASDIVTKDDPLRLHGLALLEERWKIALESAGQGLWDHDIENHDSYCSDQWYLMRGLDPRHSVPLVGENWLRNIHPDDDARLRDQIKDIETGKTDIVAYEYRERRTDGHWIWILSRGRVMKRAPNGQVLRVIGNDTDVTDLKERAEELGSLSKSLDLAVDVAGIGVWEFDPSTMETKWDRQMYTMYGLDPNKPRPEGDMWEHYLHEDDRDKANALSDHCLATKDDYALDYRIRRANGDIRHIRSRASFNEDASGRLKLIGVNWDVTSDYEAAAFLKKANDHALHQHAELEAAHAEMEHGALHDALTGLANRRKLAEFQRKIGPDAVPAVLHIDLDWFKQINDTMGHAAGDEVLIHAASILSDHAPDDALVARVGGDEFVIFLEDAPDDWALQALADCIIQASQIPYMYGNRECRFGVSVGIATSRADMAKGTVLFANADLALYLAKSEGRGRCRFYTEDLKIAAQAKKQCADEIHAGLERGEFFCVYQPQFDAQTLDLSGVEALVRWRHPSGTIWSPDKFLPTAEEMDVVSRIDRLVLEQAVADMQAWRRQGLEVPRMSVNVSSRRLADPNLASDLAILDDEPGKFAFELLESVFLDTQDAQLSANLQCIRDHGIDIEVDDFGTGHASIVGLLNLKPARLKIDRQLVKPVDKSDQQRLLVQSIVQIGKLQGIAVVAEGVETPAHIDVLRELGCDYLQGYGLASPTPAKELSALLSAAQRNGRYRAFGTN